MDGSSEKSQKVPSTTATTEMMPSTCFVITIYTKKNLKDILINIICSTNNKCLSMRVARNPHVYSRDHSNVNSPLAPKTYT